MPYEPSRDDAVPSELSRSWLLAPADRRETFANVATTNADQLVLDLGDSVPPEKKRVARRFVTSWLAEGGSAWVRINPYDSPFWSDDVQSVRNSKGLRGVILARAESGFAVSETFRRLDRMTRVVALVETAVGIEEAASIAQAEGAHRLGFGSSNYRRDIGATADDLALTYPRSRLVVASRVGELPGPIDGPVIEHDHAILRHQLDVGVSLGMTGKLCLHEAQVPIVNECFSPSAGDVAWAEDYLAKFNSQGGVIRDGSDPSHLSRARRIRGLARAFHLQWSS